MLSFPNGYHALLTSSDANASGDIDSIAELQHGIDLGNATDDGIVKRFVCTVNKLPRNE